MMTKRKMDEPEYYPILNGTLGKNPGISVVSS
jgi:hypothetical protein